MKYDRSGEWTSARAVAEIPMGRRSFLKAAAGAAVGMGLGSLLSEIPGGPAYGAEPPTHVVFGTTSEIETADPHVKYAVSAYPVSLNLYDNLLRFQGNPPRVVPWLAESYEVSPDGLTWTFRLRRGVQFHDGGELTAESVVYSMDRMLSMNKDPAGVFKPAIKPGATRARDRYTVEMRLYQPFAPFLSIIPILSVVNEKIVKGQEKSGDWGAEWLRDHEAGSGAFILERYAPATGLTMRRFERYWRGWAGEHVRSAEVKVLREVSTQILNIGKGNTHMTHTILPPDAFRQMAKMEGVTVVEDQTLRTFVIRMHNQRPPLSDPEVRRAISYAFDYDGFIKGVMGGVAVRNPGPIPVNLWGSPRELKGYSFDLDKAREHLAKAKLKVSRPLEMLAISGTAISEQAGLLLQSNLKKIGIDLRLRNVTFPQIAASGKSQETASDLTAHWMSAYYPDPDNWIGQMYDSKKWGTWQALSYYKSETMDRILSEARQVTSQQKREALYQQASRIAVDEAIDIYIYNTVLQRGLSKYLRGYQFSPVGDGLEFWPLYFSQ